MTKVSMNTQLGTLLLIVGGLLAGMGLLLLFKVNLPFGNLPGDIQIKGNQYSIYIPFTTSLLISIALSLILYLFHR